MAAPTNAEPQITPNELAATMQREFLHQSERIDKRFDEQRSETQSQIRGVHRRIDAFEDRVGERFYDVRERFERVDKRFDRVETQLGKTVPTTNLKTLEGRIVVLEHKVGIV